MPWVCDGFGSLEDTDHLSYWMWNLVASLLIVLAYHFDVILLKLNSHLSSQSASSFFPHLTFAPPQARENRAYEALLAGWQ
jgi:hypothetical protein